MTGEYTFVTAERQNELTRRIQQKLRDAAGNNEKVRIMELPVSISAPDASSVLKHVVAAEDKCSVDQTAGTSQFAASEVIPSSNDVNFSGVTITPQSNRAGKHNPLPTDPNGQADLGHDFALCRLGMKTRAEVIRKS
jgi:hypothetical protein